VTSRRALVIGGATALVVALVAPTLSAYPLTLLTQAAIVAILAMSLDVLLGYTGLPSLGHAAYFGVAAYCWPPSPPRSSACSPSGPAAPTS
jgi:branched-chain amino acid transport system permease protein